MIAHTMSEPAMSTATQPTEHSDVHRSMSTPGKLNSVSTCVNGREDNIIILPLVCRDTDVSLLGSLPLGHF